jgi:transposase
LGRSRGGWGTKIHLIADALGNPLHFSLTGAEQADITQAQPLLEAAPPMGAVIGDKGYDADAFVIAIEQRAAEAIIPPRSNRRVKRSYDAHRYRARHLIENAFARLKQFRRLATRYDKLAGHFAAFVNLACLWLWLA